MTLTEFLLDRIAEDETAARKVSAPMPVMGIKPVSVSFGKVVGLMIDPARVLAECEAKRGIVTDLSKYCWVPICTNNTCDRVGCRNLRALSLPYADHPDFDSAWRVSP
jgi:hypothetical protein